MKKLSLLLLASLTACATVTADSDQAISVTTLPAGAHCTLTNGEGSWQIAQTPGSVNVKRAFSKLNIECSETGIRKWKRVGKSFWGSTKLEASTRNRAYGNILLGGVPALVDAATGDGYEYEQPNVSLKLEDSSWEKE